MKKHIVITGVSSGIGYAFAREFASKGYTVWGAVRKETDAKRVKQAIGDNFEPLLFDVTDAEARQREYQRLKEATGDQGIVGLINNAGIAVSGPAMHVDLEDWKRQFEVNFFGLVEVTRTFLPLLGARKGHKQAPGRIINISSIGADLCAPFLGPYSASKAAVNAFSNSLRRELMLWGIDVVIYAPGAVKTPIWDKPSAQDLSPYESTPYADSGRKFQKFFVDNGKAGMEAEKVAIHVRSIFEKKKPKAKYVKVPNRFKDWIVPTKLPTRMFDRLIAKRIGFLGKK